MLTRETVERPHFDDLPEVKKPNPLPCGCGIVGIRGINRDGTAEEWRDKAIRFCPLHAGAEEMFAALKNMLRCCVGNYEQGSPAALAQKEASTVIAKIEGKSTDLPATSPHR